VELEDLPAGERAGESSVLGEVPDVPADVAAGGAHVTAGHLDGARIGLDQADQQLEQRRLAGAVRAQQAERGVRVDGERQAV
jgi:hypothetical protein